MHFSFWSSVVVLSHMNLLSQDNDPALVVEAVISDKSFNETLLYPSDGRHFTVKSESYRRCNQHRPQMVSGAAVHLGK